MIKEDERIFKTTGELIDFLENFPRNTKLELSYNAPYDMYKEDSGDIFGFKSEFHSKSINNNPILFIEMFKNTPKY